MQVLIHIPVVYIRQRKKNPKKHEKFFQMSEEFFCCPYSLNRGNIADTVIG
jgi:hypothetical protein